jgi:hypothetical protein
MIPETTIEVRAGMHPNGEVIFERLLVCDDPDGGHTLIKSPVFARGVARGDTIVMNEGGDRGFSVKQRRGNLCVRVYKREGALDVEENLTIEFEKIGGDLDIAASNVLVYSVHFGVGFSEIEKLLDAHVKGDDMMWMYANVYNPETGEPLNWWQDLLQV